MKKLSRLLVVLLALILLISTALPAYAAERQGGKKSTNSYQFKAMLSSTGLIVEDLGTHTPQDLAKALVGSGITISNVSYKGADRSAGVFSGGKDIIGFEEGIILSCGNIANVVGPNSSDGASDGLDLPGDPDLTALINDATNDATVLEFDFVPNNDIISFQYVFASEEYNEYVYNFNDVFAFFVNGTNVAVLPGTDTPVSIDNVNSGKPYGSSNAKNPQYYRNNDLEDGGGQINTEMDGLTVVLSVQAAVLPGVTNHIKLAIADAKDTNLDSVVFIKAGSLSDKPMQPGKLQFAKDNYKVKESKGTATITVNRVDGSDGQVSVQYATTDGSALAGSDYTTTSGTLIFGDGQTSATISVPLIKDEIVETAEDFTLTLSEPTGGATLGEPIVADVIITEAPGMPISNTLTTSFIVKDKDTPPPPPPTYIPPIYNLPEGDLIARWPGHIPLVNEAIKWSAKDSDITLQITDLAKWEKAKTQNLVPRIYTWNEKYQKWIALASYQTEPNRVKAINDGQYTGWMAIFAVRQPSYTDLSPTAWYEPVLNRANGMALLEGFPLNDQNPTDLLRLAKPTAFMSRSEFVAMVTRSLGLVSKNDKSMYYILKDIQDVDAVLAAHFKDAAKIPAWAKNSVASAAESGLLANVFGMDKNFDPTANITRIEAAVIISNVLDKIPGYQYKAADYTGIKDAHTIPFWAQNKVAAGVLVGDDKGNLNPNQQLNRAEAYTLFLRMIRSIGW